MLPIEHIKTFLTLYMAWLKNGAPNRNGYDFDGENFNRFYGLCGNLTDYLRDAITGDDIVEVIEARKAVRRVLSNRLVELHGDDEYPFGGMERYCQDCSTGTHHVVTERIEFVKEWLEELKEWLEELNDA